MLKTTKVVTCGGTALFELNDRLEKGWQITQSVTSPCGYTTWTLERLEPKKPKKDNKKRKAVK